MKEEIRLYYCKKLNCKLTKEGCKSLQKRAKKIQKFEHGIVNKETLPYLLDPLCQVPCLHCQNPISKLQ